MVIPSFLKKGDTVAIIGTARKISREEIQPAIELLEKSGLSVLLGQYLFESDHQYCGTTKQRTDDLQWALNNKSIKAVIIARGGYGTVKAIEHIDFKEFKHHPKWVVGYSDVTVLHNAIHNLGIASMHATMPINFLKNEEATKSMLDKLFGKLDQITAEPTSLNKSGKVKAQIVGGNLSLIYSLNGTILDIDTTDKILFIEDLDEYLYHIDRMMMQLKLSGKLKNLEALIVGGMTDMKDNTIPFGKTAEEIILDAVKEYDYPVCFNFPAGHIDRNLALPFGMEGFLTVKNDDVHLSFIQH